MLLLDQVTEAMKKLPEERNRLLKQIHNLVWEKPKHKDLAEKIVFKVDVSHLEACGVYVDMCETKISVQYCDYSLKNSDIAGMEYLAKSVCEEINEISPILQFSLRGYTPVDEKTISITIRNRF